MQGRYSSSTDYRYGFQGQEKDDEIKGEGNSLNYTFRMHDPRVGRFFAVDPLFRDYPWYTPYQFSGNKVIAFVELEGLEEHEATYDRQIQHILSTRNIQYQKGDMRKSGYVMAGGTVASLLIVADVYFTGGQVTMNTLRFFGFVSSSYAIGDLSMAMDKSEEARDARTQGDIESAERLEAETAELSKGAIFEVGGGIAAIGIGKLLRVVKLTPNGPEEIFLYRGTASLPEEKFANGFTAKGDNYNLYQHVFENPSNSGYISTTKNGEIAATFDDYVYEIKYSGNGKDVNEIFGLDHQYSYEMEISIPDRILPENIRGVYKVNKDETLGEFIKNPNYKE